MVLRHSVYLYIPQILFRFCFRPYRWIKVGVCLLSLNTIFLSSYPGRPPDEALLFVRPQYALAFLTCVVGGLGTILPGIVVLGILTTSSILQILFSLRYLPE
jgi:hypothetical protein